jgi:hypothetical protein
MTDKRSVKVNMNRMKSGEFVRTLYVITAEKGTTRKDLLEPEYWSHVAAQFKPYDRLEVRVDDETFFAEYLVLSCGRTWAKVLELSFKSLDSAPVTTEGDMDEFIITWKGPALKWCVIRESDKEIIKDKLEKDDATKFLAGYLKTIAA